MDDQVAVVLHHPFAGFVALDGQPAIALFVQGGVDFFADGVDLPSAEAGGEDKEIVQGSDPPHVKDQYIPALVFGGDVCGQASAFQRGRDEERFSCLGNDSQQSSFRTWDRREEVGQLRMEMVDASPSPPLSGHLRTGSSQSPKEQQAAESSALSARPEPASARTIPSRLSSRPPPPPSSIFCPSFWVAAVPNEIMTSIIANLTTRIAHSVFSLLSFQTKYKRRGSRAFLFASAQQMFAAQARTGFYACAAAGQDL